MPHSMMTVLYTIVCLKLWSRKVPGEGNNQNEEQAAALKIVSKSYPDDDNCCGFISDMLAPCIYVSSFAFCC